MTVSGTGRLASQAAARRVEPMVDLDGLSIRIESPSSDTARDLVRQSANGSADCDDLKAPNSEFLVARLDGLPVGCIALVDHLRYGEARRLYVTEEVRGNGIAVALVEALEAAAREIGLRRIRIAEPANTRIGLRPFTRQGYRPTAEMWMEKAL